MKQLLLFALGLISVDSFAIGGGYAYTVYNNRCVCTAGGSAPTCEDALKSCPSGTTADKTAKPVIIPKKK